MKEKDPNHPYNRGYKSVMDDPHYDPPDPYYHLIPSRGVGGQMTRENRQAMYKVLFSGDVGSNVNYNPTPLFPIVQPDLIERKEDGSLKKEDESLNSTSSNTSHYVNNFRYKVHYIGKHTDLADENVEDN